MRLFQALLVLAFLLPSAQALAHGNGACASYAEACKKDPSVTSATDKKAKWEAMGSCITKNATDAGDSGKACLAEQAKHKAHHMHGAGAPPAGSPPAAGT